MDYEWIEKTIFKKNQIKEIRKKTENQCQNAACEEKTTNEKFKFNSNKKIGLEWAVNGLGKLFGKKSDPKNRKNSKNQSEIAACEQKNHYRETEFLFKHRFLTLL